MCLSVRYIVQNAMMVYDASMPVDLPHQFPPLQVHGKDNNLLNSIQLANTCYCRPLCLCFQLTCIALVWVRDQVDCCADINYLLSVLSIT